MIQSEFKSAFADGSHGSGGIGKGAALRIASFSRLLQIASTEYLFSIMSAQNKSGLPAAFA